MHTPVITEQAADTVEHDDDTTQTHTHTVSNNSNNCGWGAVDMSLCALTATHTHTQTHCFMCSWLSPESMSAQPHYTCKEEKKEEKKEKGCLQVHVSCLAGPFVIISGIHSDLLGFFQAPVGSPCTGLHGSPVSDGVRKLFFFFFSM